MKQLRSNVISLSALLVLSAVGCSYYPQEDGERLHNEVYALLTQVNAMQQALSELKDAEKRQSEELAEMTREVGELSKNSRRNSADFGVSIDEMREEFARLKGNVDSYSERVSTLEAGFSKVQEELDLRFANLAEQAKVEKAKSEAEKEQAIQEAKQRETLLQDPDKLFAQVEKSITADKAAEHRRLLRDFMIRAQQNSRLKSHLPRAQYLIAETFFAEGKFQNAAAEYNAVRRNFEKSPLVPNALLKLGMCFEKLKLPNDAKLFYKTVVQKYAKSAAAKEAAQRLKQL